MARNPVTLGLILALARELRTAASTWVGLNVALAPASSIGARRRGSSIIATIGPSYPTSRALKASSTLASSSPFRTRARARVSGPEI